VWVQFLSAERKMTSREIQTMLEKNEAALRAWNALHTQERTQSHPSLAFGLCGCSS
jgi:hypothetical protein